MDTSYSTSDSARRFVSVPVPEEHVVPVMRFIAELDAPAAPVDAGPTSPEPVVVDAGPTSPEPVVDADAGSWTTEDLRRLASGRNYTTRLLGEIMDVLADVPDEWRDLDALSEATGYDRAGLKGIWTHVGRHIRKRYPGHKWPLDARWGPRIDPSWPSVMFYRLPAAQAAKWKEVRSAGAAA